MSHSGLPRRAAHLSYVAPLVAGLFWLQSWRSALPEHPVGGSLWALPLALVGAGVLLALVALRGSADAAIRRPAFVGLGTNSVCGLLGVSAWLSG